MYLFFFFWENDPYDPYVSNFNFKLANSPQPKLSKQRHIHFNKKSFIGNLFSLAMESSASSSSSSSKYSLSSWEYLALLFIRPILAIAFVISLISLGNYLSISFLHNYLVFHHLRCFWAKLGSGSAKIFSMIVVYT